VPADRDTMRFARAVLNRPYKFTIAFLVANIFVFLLMWQSSGMSFQALWLFPTNVLVAYGSKLNVLIREQHQWWRFVTPMFVHVGVLHLLVNMYSLWIVGPYVEKLYGSAKFVVFWVLTGTAGVVGSYLTVVGPDRNLGPLARFIFKTQDSPSAGASGALFGLVGVLFVFGIKYRHELPEGFKRAFGTGMLPIIVLNLFIGYMAHGLIDNAAHLGGLASGAFLALFISYRRPGERTGLAVTWTALQIAALALVVLSFLNVGRHFRDPLPIPAADESVQIAGKENQSFLLFAKAMDDGQEAFIVAVKDSNAGNVDAALKELDAAPTLDQKSGELKEKLKVLLTKAKAHAEKGKPKPGAETQAADQLSKEYDGWIAEYEQWLKTTGKQFALEFK